MDDFDFIFTVFYKHFLFLHFQLHIGTMDLSKDVLQQPGMFCIALHSTSNEIVMDPTRSANFLCHLYQLWMDAIIAAENATSGQFCVRKCPKDNLNSCTNFCIDDTDLCDGTIDIYDSPANM